MPKREIPTRVTGNDLLRLVFREKRLSRRQYMLKKFKEYVDIVHLHWPISAEKTTQVSLRFAIEFSSVRDPALQLTQAQKVKEALSVPVTLPISSRARAILYAVK